MTYPWHNSRLPSREHLGQIRILLLLWLVMQTMLGSWNKNVGGGKHMGSELAQKVAINEIAESIMTFNTNYKETGLFGIYAVAKPDCVDDLAHAIMYGLTKLA